VADDESPDTWTVWGDQPEPIFEGSKEAAVQYVKDRPQRIDLYFSDDAGDEWDLNSETGELERI
jgi:hypothetical protein